MVVTPVIHVILTLITSLDLELKLNKLSVCEETRSGCCCLLRLCCVCVCVCLGVWVLVL